MTCHDAARLIFFSKMAAPPSALCAYDGNKYEWPQLAPGLSTVAPVDCKWGKGGTISQGAQLDKQEVLGTHFSITQAHAPF